VRRPIRETIVDSLLGMVGDGAWRLCRPFPRIESEFSTARWSAGAARPPRDVRLVAARTDDVR
jgi:hypothetical protein